MYRKIHTPIQRISILACSCSAQVLSKSYDASALSRTRRWIPTLTHDAKNSHAKAMIKSGKR